MRDPTRIVRHPLDRAVPAVGTCDGRFHDDHAVTCSQ